MPGAYDNVMPPMNFHDWMPKIWQCCQSQFEKMPLHQQPFYLSLKNLKSYMSESDHTLNVSAFQSTLLSNTNTKCTKS